MRTHCSQLPIRELLFYSWYLGSGVSAYSIGPYRAPDSRWGSETSLGYGKEKGRSWVSEVLEIEAMMEKKISITLITSYSLYISLSLSLSLSSYIYIYSKNVA